MLEQFCDHSKQCRNNVATLCCAKNRRCESSRVRSPYLNCPSKGRVSLFAICSFPIKDLKTDSIRKSSNFNFQWTKTLYQNNSSATTIKFGNLFLITYLENICKSDLPCQVWSPNMIWKCVYLHGNFRKCVAAITRFKKWPGVVFEGVGARCDVETSTRQNKAHKRG